MARSRNPGVGIERRDTMNPSLWTPTYIKRKLLSSPSCGAIENFFPVTRPNKKPETLRNEHPRESGPSTAARQAGEFAPANSFPAICWSPVTIRLLARPDRSGSGFSHPEILIAHGSESLQEENRENENFWKGGQVFNFALKAAGTLTILPPRSTKA